MMQFLNRVYVTDQDESIAYEIVKADENFTHIEVFRVDCMELRKLADRDDITDFSFEKGFLKCAFVPRVIISKEVEKTVNQGSVTSDYFLDSFTTFFNLLHTGASNDFLFVKAGVVEQDTWVGDEVTEFTNVRFCSHSMMAWYLEKSPNVGKRYDLIVSKKNDFALSPFYYAVPLGFVGAVAGKYLKIMRINNCDYKVYFVDTLQLIEPVNIISAALINKACCKSVRLQNVIKVLNALLGFQVDETEEAAERAVTTIVFESSLPRLTDEETEIFLDFLENGKEPEESVKQKFDYLYHVCQSISRNSPTKSDLIAQSDFVKREMEKETLALELYLFRIRAFECKTGYKRLKVGTTLIGSDEKGFTVVKGEG